MKDSEADTSEHLEMKRAEEGAIVKISTMCGWEWVVPPNKEHALIHVLNALGRERPTESMEKLAERMKKLTEDWTAYKMMERHAEGLLKLAVMAEKRGLHLSTEATRGLATMHGAEWAREVEDVYQPENLRKLADAMEEALEESES